MKLFFHPCISVCFMKGFAVNHKLCPWSRVIDCMADYVACVTVFAAPK